MYPALVQLLLELGKYDFSEEKSVSNDAVPGTLIRKTKAEHEARITDLIIYNPAATEAVITFYDQDGKMYLPLKIGSGETAKIDMKASIVYGEKDIYARTDQATNAEITIAGREIPKEFGWGLR